MIFNKFLDKTLEAAKQSALQIAGDDYSQIKSIMPGHNGESNDQRSSNRKNKKGQPEQASDGRSASNENANKKGVVFERTSAKPAGNSKPDPNSKLNKRLESIRKYAAQQGDSEDSVDRKNLQAKAPPSAKENKTTRHSPQPNNQFYSRKAIRNKDAAKEMTHPSNNNVTSQSPYDLLEEDNIDSSPQNDQAPLDGNFVPELPNGSPTATEKYDNKQDEYKGSEYLHKRLDRLESLMHLALSTPPADFVDHPLFHRLIHKGVSKKIIRGWFEKLIEKGIQPAQQFELFSSELLQLINELLRQSEANTPSKMMVFTGRSGAGKTQLIMKLINVPNFLKDKKVAVVSFNTDEGNLKNNYSLLEPFCRDYDINFYSLHKAREGYKYQDDWAVFDHILVDTPALDMGGSPLIKAINNLKEQLNTLWACETHYLVNTAVTGTAFNDPLAQDIHADHVAFTHIDQSLKWGKAIQLLTNTNYKVRYLSTGPSIIGDLLPFVPLKFAHKLLRVS